MIKTLKEADAIHGGLSSLSKMPGYAYGIPAKHCKVGAQLFKIKNSVCSTCYALKGRYVFPNVQAAQERRFQTLTDPRWVEAIVWTLKKRNCGYFRWHDSGDVQGMWHLKNLVEVALQCPETKFWLPTRENKLVLQYLRDEGPFPENFVVRVSGAMIDGYAPIKFFNTSTVTTKKSEATCPAYTQGGECGDCRHCWDGKVRNVSYPKH